MVLELNVNKNIKRINQDFDLGLSDLEMIFWQNNPFQINDKNQIKTLLQKKINDLYKKLMELPNHPEYFEIYSENNPDLDREFDSQIKALIFRGEKDRAELAEENQKQVKKEMAKTLGENNLLNINIL